MSVALPEGCALVALAQTGSTNDVAKDLAAAGAADGTVVWAREQTAGRGRRGREWVSPVGNLYLSVLLRPGRPPVEAAQLSLVAAVALGDAIAGFLPEHAELHCKWPNDILVNGRKVAGILLESAGAASGRMTDWVVVGCGVNITGHPPETLYPATDLKAEGAATASVEPVLERFLESFFHWRDRWLDSGVEAVRAAWMARAAGLGQDITVRLPNREIRGRFVDMDRDGALLLEGPDGVRQTISAGDVFL
jgi:BirA family transcriptional regulator, biotin operon repressor / biotin---[acetyl-CoA-carboxylase] ligase